MRFQNFLVPSFKAPTDKWIITDKTKGVDGYWLEFHAPEYPGPDGKQTMSFPFWFYKTARVGDELRMNVGSGDWGMGYTLLVRNGRVVARKLSRWQKKEILIIADLLFPLAVFFKWKNKQLRLVIFGAAALAEAIAIGTILFWALFFIALAFGGGSFG